MCKSKKEKGSHYFICEKMIPSLIEKGKFYNKRYNQFKFEIQNAIQNH